MRGSCANPALGHGDWTNLRCRNADKLIIQVSREYISRLSYGLGHNLIPSARAVYQQPWYLLLSEPTPLSSQRRSTYIDQTVSCAYYRTVLTLFS
jgi:hypothetical protein